MSAILAVVALLASSQAAFAQGCSMCYSTAAAAKTAAIQALRNGIIILMIPPMLITLAVFIFACRSRERSE